MSETRNIIEVVMPLHLERTFHYLVPPALTTAALPGCRVLVPFRHRTLTAYILAIIPSSPHEKLKPIISVLDDTPLWTEGELEFFRWVASYYLHPLGDVIKTALPAGINLQSQKTSVDNSSLTGGKKIKYESFYLAVAGSEPSRNPGSKSSEILALIRENQELPASDLRRRFGQCSQQLKRLVELGVIRREERETYRDPFANQSVTSDLPRQLNQHQEAARVTFCAAVDSGRYAPFLLHGVTGSGKTEVYLQTIAHALELGGNALVLVPEISLTPQLVGRFRARFRDGIAVLHSGLSDGERYDEWRRIRRGQVRIVIGARSAIFAPLQKISIIVVDEEHEASFKQSEGLRYNARDLALVRGKMEGAVVLLGSATPQITTLHAVEQGRMALASLPSRVEDRPLPTVQTVVIKGNSAPLSPLLLTALEQTVANGEQALVFLNRRGFATTLVCGECGTPLSCPNCSVTLTYHRQRRQSLCHYCDYAVPAPCICPACSSPQMDEAGTGTERVEHELREHLPTARIIRMDSDTTSGKGGLNRLLDRMNDRSADILIGTQMITKGHDFPGVTLVGVLDAEASLNLPDFRSAERTFQILRQVFGRAGRGTQPGRVIVQTRNPDHYAVACAIAGDSNGFYQQEIAYRQEAGYPPYAHLATLSLNGNSETAVEQRSEATAHHLRRIKSELGLRIEILGPAPAPLYRLRGRYRRQILLKSPTRNDLRRLLNMWYQQRETGSSVREQVDIDPVDMM